MEEVFKTRQQIAEAIKLAEFVEASQVKCEIAEFSFSGFISLIESKEITIDDSFVFDSSFLEMAICGVKPLGIYIVGSDHPYVANWQGSIERAATIFSFINSKVLNNNQPFKLTGSYNRRLAGVAFEDFSFKTRLRIERISVPLIFVEKPTQGS